MNPRSDLTSWGLLILRLGAGLFMATHGWGKFQTVLAGNFDQFGDPIGLGKPASLILATSAEFFCALLVAVGLFTRLAALPLVFTMGVAAFVVHASDPLTMQEGAELFRAELAKSWSSKEPALLYLSAFLALALTGAGRYSLDAVLASRRRSAGSPPA